MIHASANAIVPATPREILEFCLDSNQYQTINHKITKFYSSPPMPASGEVEMEFRAKIRGIPGARQRERVVLDRWHSIHYKQVGGWMANQTLSLEGAIITSQTPNGTLVTNRYDIDFKGGPIGWAMERFTGDWLQTDTQAEVNRLAAAFAGPHPIANSSTKAQQGTDHD